MNYTIQAIRAGGIKVSGAGFFFQERYFETIDACLWIWLIRGNGKTIVVDTGLRKVPLKGNEGKFYIAEDEYTEEALAKFGVKPSDVDYLILTHLHHDHCENAHLFTKAKIFISAWGWASVFNPPARTVFYSEPPLFPRDTFAHLAHEAWDRVVLLEEEDNILPGIDVFWVGGHSPCSQAIVVDTKQGKALLPGDGIFFYENLEKNIPVGLNYSLEECYRAMERFREYDIILPNHEKKVAERYPGGKVG